MTFIICNSVLITSYVLGLNAFVLLLMTFYNLVIYKRRLNNTRRVLLDSHDSGKAILSKELHDVVGSFLVPFKSDIESLPAASKVECLNKLDQFQQFIKQTTQISYPQHLYKESLADSINQLSRLLSNETTKVSTFTKNTPSVGKDRELQVFILLLELTSNICSHDKPEQLVIYTCSEKNVKFNISFTSETDESNYINTDVRSDELDIIEQRLLFLDGDIDIDVFNNEFTIQISIPIRE